MVATVLAWLIAPAIVLTGRLVWARLPAADGETEDVLETAFATLVSGVYIAGFLGLALAELGWLRPAILTGGLATIALACWRVLPARTNPARDARSQDLWAAAVVCVLAAASGAPASEDLLGGRDPGVYANTGTWLARTGTLRIHADALTTIPADTRPLFFAANGGRRQVYMLGFFVRGDGATGEIMPQFMHLLPVYLAIGYWLGVMTGAFLVPPFFGIAAALSVFLFVRRLLGVGPALVATGLLLVNLAQIWATRSPITEGASQLGVFATLWCIARGFDSGGPRWGILGAFALGSCFLLRVDALLCLAAVLPALTLLYVSSPRRWLTHLFLPIAALAALWGTLHGWLFATQYMRDLSARVTALWVLTGVVLLLCIPVLRAHRRATLIVERAYRHGRMMWALVALALSLAFAYGMWIRPRFDPGVPHPRSYNDETLVRVAWYFSQTGMVIALGGVVLLLRRWLVRRQVEWTPFLFSVLAFSCLYFWKPMIYADHPWEMRRYLPVVVPGICVGIAAAAHALWSTRGGLRHLARVAATVAVAVVLWHEVGMARPFWRLTEKGGALAAVERIARLIPADAVVLFTHPGNDVVVATPLAMLFGRSVLPVVRDQAADAPREQHRRLFDAQIDRWMRTSREVFYVAAEDGDAPFATLNARWELIARAGVSVPMFGAPLGQRPRTPGMERMQYHVARAVPNPDTLPVCAPRALRADAVLLGTAEGFYSLETRRFDRYRWVKPRARLVFRSCDRLKGRPRVLRIRAACGPRPAATSCDVAVDVNGVSAGHLSLTDEWSIADLPIPDAAAAAPAGAFDVRFYGPRIVAAEAGTPSDRRELSFQFASAALVPADTPASLLVGGRGAGALPRGLNLITPAAQDIWAVRQYGFHDVERPDGRIMRWTGRSARVVVPPGHSRPTTVRVQVARTIRPAQPVRISANGCPLFNGALPRSESDVTLSLARCAITGEELTIAIEADAVRPRGERRELAVALRSIYVD